MIFISFYQKSYVCRLSYLFSVFQSAGGIKGSSLVRGWNQGTISGSRVESRDHLGSRKNKVLDHLCSTKEHEVHTGNVKACIHMFALPPHIKRFYSENGMLEKMNSFTIFKNHFLNLLLHCK